MGYGSYGKSAEEHMANALKEKPCPRCGEMRPCEDFNHNRRAVCRACRSKDYRPRRYKLEIPEHTAWLLKELGR